MNDLQCPSCGRDDQVQSVSAIVQGGTSTTQYQGNGYGFGVVGNSTVLIANQSTTTGTTQTALARLLNPPARPTVSDVSGTVFGGIVLLLLGAFGVWVGLSSYDAWFFGVGGGVTVLVGLFVLLYARGEHDFSVEKCRRDMPAWELAGSVWLHISYCHRCACLCLPPFPKVWPIDCSVSALTGIFKDAEEMAQQEKERKERSRVVRDRRIGK